MFFKYTVPVPAAVGKISRQYDPAKKHTVPVRAMIGKVSDEEGMMFPNEKFFEYFPETPLPELRPAAERSCTLMAGTFVAIEEVVNHYRLDELLAKHFGDRAGLIRCHTNFRHPFNLSWSGKTCDIRRSSKTTS